MQALLLFIIFYVLHSLLAANAAKNWVKQRFPSLFPAYRLLYNLFSLMLFGYALALHLFRDQSPMLPACRPFPVLASLLMAEGLIITAIALKGYNLAEFSGLRAETHHQQLQRNGLNRYVRHPLYSGLILSFIGFLLLYPSTERAWFFLLSMVYLFIGIRLEEAKLAQLFGSQYRQYQQEIPMLLPRLFFWRAK